MPASPDPMKRSRTNTKQRLLDAAFEVFADRGFEAATVEEICGAAGFTRGAFYSNYESKEELFFALWSARAASILDGLGALAAELFAAPEHMDETIDQMVRGVTQDRRWFVVSTEFMLYAIRNPAAAARLGEHRRALFAGLADLVRTVMDALGSDTADELDVDTRARMIVAAIEGVQHQIWVESDTLSDGTLPVAMVRQLLT